MVNQHLRMARLLVDVLENRFRLFNFKFGLDPVLGLIPGLGDALSLGISLYIVWVGVHMKLPNERIIEMLGNVVADFIIGSIPVIGDFGDFIFKANTKNLRILEQYGMDGTVIEGESVS